MPRVVSLIGYLPPPRFDGAVWTMAEISETADPDAGPWAVIDVQSLSPLDTDPTRPELRSFTTTQAQLTDGWYRLVFVDAPGNRSDPSEPARSSTDELRLPPSPDAIRNLSPLLRAKYPLPPTDAYQLTDLRNQVAQAIGLVEALTWRTIDTRTPCPAPDGYVCQPVPDGLVPVVFQVVAGIVARLTVTGAPDFAEQVATGRILAGFTAGPYSESYVQPGQYLRRGVELLSPMDTNEDIAAGLWALATEDARDYWVWRHSGQAPPTGVAVAFDYRKQSRGDVPGGLGRGLY